jgi:protein subunit release factor B
VSEEAPVIYPLDRESLERDSSVSFFVAGGPGGQHRNKVSTGVRLVHHPSGMVVTATERRSQAANREAAFERLARRLAAAQARPELRIATQPSRAERAQRRTEKRRRAQTKQQRRPVRPADHEH